jgi:hypothetical protein
MKTKNKVLINLLSASFIVGGSIAIIACQQSMSLSAADEGEGKGAAGPERKAKAARFNDGDYTFYFKNGRTASGDCDGYSSEYGGSTTIYELWRSDIKEWIGRVKAAGATNVKTNSDKSHPGYYWVSFPTDLIYGTGLYYGNHEHNRGNAYFRMNGKETRVKYTTGLNLAQADSSFNWSGEEFRTDSRKNFSKAHEGAAVPELALGMLLYFGSEKSLVYPLKDAGYTFKKVNNDDKYVLIDASDIEWFAYDY